MMEIEINNDGAFWWQWKIVTDVNEISDKFYLEGSGFDTAEEALADAIIERDYINKRYWQQRQLTLF